MNDYFFRDGLNDLDPALENLIELERERQYRKIILIASESQAPAAVRHLLSSEFQNIYAEGYPNPKTRYLAEQELFDYEQFLADFRRNSSPRYYKGVEYADVIEAVARRRCAETFSTPEVDPDEIFVNVQPLSGSPANNAVFQALIEPGDTILGMDLLHGGHLSHGAPVHRTGYLYNVAHYTVDPVTEKLNFELIRKIAEESKPKVIIAGYTSYPWAADWEKFREIADEVGAYLLADIAHVAGLVAAGVYPSPVGIADVITFTTHKSICGPRGACILTTDSTLSRRIDRAVFPGEQGGPHVNTMAAMALAFKLTQSDQFKSLQQQVVKNSAALVKALQKNQLNLPYGGTNTHMLLVDTSKIKGKDGCGLSGDMAARILDLAGIVVNRNTIPGDSSALDPSGIRLGTPWVTQRGMREKEMEILADLISEVLLSSTPYWLAGGKRPVRRAKIDFNELEIVKIRVHDLARSSGAEQIPTRSRYPHFYYLDDRPGTKWVTFRIEGYKVRQFLNYSLTNDIENLNPGVMQSTRVITPAGEIKGTLMCQSDQRFLLNVASGKAGLAANWLRSLSDGFIKFDDDILRKLPGPVIIAETDEPLEFIVEEESESSKKPFVVGLPSEEGDSLPEFKVSAEESEIMCSLLAEKQAQLGAEMKVFDGWEMPSGFTSIEEEFTAVRDSAGLIDLSLKSVFQVEGPDALSFLDCIAANDISQVSLGATVYTHLLDPDADVIDDVIIIHRDEDKFILIGNALNELKTWLWMNDVQRGQVLTDRKRPWVRSFGKHVNLKNLHDLDEEMVFLLSVQGPESQKILRKGVHSEGDLKKLHNMNKGAMRDLVLFGKNILVTRTGFTGEKLGFDLLVHAEHIGDIYNSLLDRGAEYGIKPVGMLALDNLRIEAGLPLYGHEFGFGSGRLGASDLGPGEAGFSRSVKTYKPWFIGRRPFIEKEKSREHEVVRFKVIAGVSGGLSQGNSVLSENGQIIGWVTSIGKKRDDDYIGQALVHKSSKQPGNRVYVYKQTDVTAVESGESMRLGDIEPITVEAEIISRFL
jgi:glycine hydroxymethyltransferase